MSERIFISSVQKELAEERRAIRDFVRGDALLGRFFDVFLFEDLPASDRRADEVYLDEVGRCPIYVGLFGQEYGYEDATGLSPTEREFNRATTTGKTRLIFVKGFDDKARHPKMQALVRKAGAQLIRRRFTGIADLTSALYASLVEHLENSGVLQNRLFEDRPAPDATLNHIDLEAVTAFVRRARSARQFPLPESAPVTDVLAHLGLLHGRQPTNAAMLLFGQRPQHFVPAAEVRCMHFHGTEIQRPAPSYQIFNGRLFDQVDRAADFVLGVINRTVGTRALSSQAPVAYEIPPDVIREAIVNAVVHRDYASGAAVQVSVFADRVEVWNPGVLTPPLTPEGLRHPHRSITRNPRIAETLFLARYIEKYGTGTLMMIRETAAHALPEPDFEQRGGEFVITVWRDWLTEQLLAGLKLNRRQQDVISHLKVSGRIGNLDYRRIFGVSKPTASRDLEELCTLGVLTKVGSTGKGTHYVLNRKGLTKGSKDSQKSMGSQRAQRTHPPAGVSGKPDLKPKKRTSARASIDRPVSPAVKTRRKSAKLVKRRANKARIGRKSKRGAR
jgi:ATP-dependent DNA helicase RecG